MHDHTFSMLANHLIRHQATCNKGGQPSDYRWYVNLPQGMVRACMDTLIHFITP